MEGAVANYTEGVAQALVGKLGQLLSEEYRLLSSVRGEILHLRDDVAIMNALLRMLSEADDGAVDHFVREWMKQVRELGYDAEDCIDLFVRRISCGPRGVWPLAVAWNRVVTLRARHRLAGDIKVLRARSVAVAERRVRFGVDGQSLRPAMIFVSAAASSSQVLSAANELVGIEDQVNWLSNKVKSVDMMNDNQIDKKLKVFSILGFGGLGKTTLAVEVCHRLEEEFACQATVTVSQAFDASKDLSGLLLRMLQQVVKVKRDNEQKGMQEEDPLGDIDDNVDSLARILMQRLADKRYITDKIHRFRSQSIFYIFRQRAYIRIQSICILGMYFIR
jgi:disease resistance protein RPM1